MALFASEEEVYDRLGARLRALVEDPVAGRQLQRADTVVQCRCHEPQATITLDLRMGSEPRVAVGACAELEPEVVLDLAAETLRALLAGDANMPVALARGDVCAHGPVGKLLKVVLLSRRAALEQAAPVPAKA